MPLAAAYANVNLSSAVAEQLMSMARLVRYEEGEYIFREGDHALNLCIVESGEVAIELNLPPHGPTTLTTAGPSEWFSWSALLEPRIERASARATTATEVWAIRGGAIMDCAIEDHEFGFQIYRALADLIATRLNFSWLQILQMLTP
jgi:CRP/FNR family transcriptional regulator, cyclic AMP receptor protein